MKKKVIILICTVGLLVVGAILYLNSFKLNLLARGYSTNVTYYDRGYNINDHEYCVVGVKNGTDNGVVNALYMEKNGVGFWRIRNEAYTMKNDNGIQTNWLTWSNSGSFISFHGFYDKIEYDTTFQRNELYIGTNAKKMLDIPQDKIPRGVAMKICQSSKSYTIMLTTYLDDTQVINDFMDYIEEEFFK